MERTRSGVKKHGEKKARRRHAPHGAQPGDRPAVTADTPEAAADVAEITEIAEVMYSAALARMATVAAREKAAAERDEIANTRDRTAVERDQMANQRERAAAERQAIAVMQPTTGRVVPDLTPDDDALERARLEAELQRAHLDALTGAFRREVGRLALRNEIERARRADGKFIIAFVDVDGLKGVNDRDGHAAGDRVLRTLAATMRANLRSYDPIVRFGGDEFICGISSIGPDEVQHRIGVIDQSLRHATGVGITAGLASLTSNETLEELTARADAALLEAKRSRGD
jgi:diguanylate cyclase (GGDEF)-like protein